MWPAATSRRTSAPPGAAFPPSNRLTVSSGPPLTDQTRSSECSPKSSSARASMNTSSIALAVVSRPGRTNIAEGG